MKISQAATKIPHATTKTRHRWIDIDIRTVLLNDATETASGLWNSNLWFLTFLCASLVKCMIPFSKQRLFETFVTEGNAKFQLEISENKDGIFFLSSFTDPWILRIHRPHFTSPDRLVEGTLKAEFFRMHQFWILHFSDLHLQEPRAHIHVRLAHPNLSAIFPLVLLSLINFELLILFYNHETENYIQ